MLPLICMSLIMVILNYTLVQPLNACRLWTGCIVGRLHFITNSEALMHHCTLCAHVSLPLTSQT